MRRPARAELREDRGGVVSLRDEFQDLSDFDLDLRSVEVAAERTRLEAHELHDAGFTPTNVIGTGTLLWRRAGRLYTHDYAVAEVMAIPDQKEEPT